MIDHNSYKKYLFFAFLCISCIILLHSFVSPPIEEKFDFKLTKESLKQISGSPAFILLGFGYTFIFFIGIINVFHFSIIKFARKPLLDIREAKQKFPLDATNASKLLFFITLYVLAVDLITIFLIRPPLTLSPLNLSVSLNFAVEIGIIIIIFMFIPKQSLGININTVHFPSLLKIYTALLPLTILALLLNTFILEKLGIHPTLNPAIGLFFLLKHKFFIFILMVEIVIFAPIAEELFFRAFIYKFMKKRFSFFLSTLFTSFIFAIVHRATIHILPLLILSFALCYLYEKTQIILTPIFLHAIHNFLNLSFLVVIKNTLPL
ncbi:MAG: CPBP family intramembrane metalloprotease [Candidatus Omnitrophota bacterium]|nr:MAG: CPBP family intramembrane metalloprotease [Candidatus Omnitrophota bacterium]